MIKSISYNNDEILKWIIDLYVPEGQFHLDPTYSKGQFYKGTIPQPKIKSDLYPKADDIIKADAADLPFDNNSISSIMFDPPFLAGYYKDKPTGIMGKRFHGFRKMEDCWAWYDKCLIEAHRILKKKGVLVFKCQDTISSGKQFWSHTYIQNKAEKLGFYQKDLFILLAKSRMVGHNHKIQKHSRKFHSYFIVLIKK